jgi:hypothetical protein
MNEELLTQEALMDWSSAQTKPALIRWLTANHIPFTFSSKKKIVTTVSAVNTGLLGTGQHREVQVV